MGKQRAYSSHVRWTRAETAVLQRLYHDAAWQTIFEALPERTRQQISCKANSLGLTRYRAPKMSEEERRKRKREGMARKRAADPEASRAYGRKYHADNRKAQTAKMRDYYRERFFWGRAQKLTGITAWDLWRLWKRQRGLCGLTGRRLDRTAQVDHIHPRAKGGGDEIENLRWVCRQANLAKRAMSDESFLRLCSEVVVWAHRQSSGPVYCIDFGGVKSSCSISEDVSPTLATTHGGAPVIVITEPPVMRWIGERIDFVRSLTPEAPAGATRC